MAPSPPGAISAWVSPRFGWDEAVSVTLSAAALEILLPMHLLTDRQGMILTAGPGMRKLAAHPGQRMQHVFTLLRHGVAQPASEALYQACRSDERLFLRMRHAPHLTLRGHAVPAGGGFLLNLGFGIGLVEAVRALDLNDSDFAPPELAMELLFLHEANRAVMTELSHYNTRLDAAREKAETQAFTDPLTGLHNRRGLERAIDSVLRQAGGGRARFAIAHLDLDHFKQVNDEYGHAAGDIVLQHVARVLQDTIRNGDTAARIGGDEFLLLLPGTASIPALERLARRLIQRIGAPIRAGPATCRVSASIGIVRSCDYPEVAVARMLEDADAALYRAKHEGRGRARIARPDGTANA